MSDRADRVGLAWRDELALEIHAHLAQIDCLEILAEREYEGGRRRIRALRELARQVPLSVHSVALGLASTEATDTGRLDRLARLVDRVRPQHWSEHLAFVRAGGYEIGHLAAPPLAPCTLQGLAGNLERARRIVGSLPHLENVATLIWPAGSTLSEEAFIGGAVGHGTPLLLDLHNWYANARNFGKDPCASIDALPLAQVASIHISGGVTVRDADGRERLIDDHIHDPPDEVFDLLAHVAARCPQPLEVIIERDGKYPPFSHLLAQMKRARSALREGRSRATGMAA